MYGCELDHKVSWTLKKWCLRSVVLEKTLESPKDSKESKPVNPKGNQPWIFMEGLMLNLKFQYIGHLMGRDPGLIGKDPDAGKNWRQKEKREAGDEMVR